MELFDYLKTNENYQLVLKGNDVAFNLTIALPLGLMLNELMLNSFKHSYKDKDKGKTEIEINSTENTLTIDYCDCSGVFPEQIDFKHSNTTGLMLIHTFAEQLKGNVNLISNSPPHYLIQIPINE